MKFNLSLKYSHLWVIDDLKEKNSISSNQEIVKRCVSSALQLQDDDSIFGTIREQCGEGCFASEPQFEVDMEESDFNRLRQIYKDYDFMEYGSEEEEISKTVRCIIKFIEEKADLISI
tara:strand:+ start:285 stop:638 length:354 start_codon:yes stop_codon:yes gene_type:complete